jgi:two-component sensor histidine kinase/Tfp pilus assembly protein PilF
MICKNIIFTALFLITCVFANAQNKADSVFTAIQSINSIEQKIDYLNRHIRSNTNQRAAQMRPYIDMADELLNYLPYFYKGENDLLINKIRFYSYIGKSDSAFLMHKKIVPQKLTKEQEAWFLFSEADILVHNGEQEKGMKSLLSALKILDESVKNPSLKAMTLNDIGNVYFMQIDYQNALKYYKLAIEIRKNIAEYKALASTYNNLGSVFKNMEKTDSARFYYLKSYEIRSKIADSMGISGVYNNLGVLAEKELNFNLAAEYFNKAFELGISYGDSLSALPMLINVGNAQWRAKDYSKAEKTLETAVDLAKRSNSSFLESKAYQVLARLFNEKGEHKKAYELILYAISVSLKHSNSETLRITKELESKYENEKNSKTILIQQNQLNEEKIKLLAKEKEQKILILTITAVSILVLVIMYLYRRQRAISKKLKIQTNLLDKSNREIELLLREIHHRVKNNLQIISSLLNIQAKSINHPDAVLTLKESQSRIHSIALVHDKLYMNDSLDKIDVPNYLGELCKDIITSFESETKIKLHAEFTDLDINVNLAMQLGIIINEILTNSLKYAFMNSGSPQIDILLKKHDDDKFELSIKDNGNGMNQNMNKKSFGIYLIESMTEKINGTLTLKSDQNGTSYQIIFSNKGQEN